MTQADKIVAVLLESDPPKGRVVVFGRHTYRQGMRNHSLDHAIDQLWEYRVIRAASRAEAWEKIQQTMTVLQNDNGSLRVYGRAKPGLDRRVLDNALEWIGLDPEDTTIFAYTDMEGKTDARLMTDTLLSAAEYQDVQHRRALERSKNDPTPEPGESEEVWMQRRRGYAYAGRPRMQIDPAEEERYRAQITGTAIGQQAFIGLERGKGYTSGDGHYGIVVREVVPDGPLARAGVKPWDVIMAIGGQRIKDAEHYEQIAKSLVAGTPYTIVVMRETKEYRARIWPESPR